MRVYYSRQSLGDWRIGEDESGLRVFFRGREVNAEPSRLEFIEMPPHVREAIREAWQSWNARHAGRPQPKRRAESEEGDGASPKIRGLLRKR